VAKGGEKNNSAACNRHPWICILHRSRRTTAVRWTLSVQDLQDFQDLGAGLRRQ